MMRLARWTSLLVAFSLLTSAATAYAECAWVLWVTLHTTFRQKDGTVYGKQSTELLRAFPTVAECGGGLREEEQKARALASSMNIKKLISAERLELSITTFFDPKEQKDDPVLDPILGKVLQSMVFSKCLPDTVDPRGPRGSTR